MNIDENLQYDNDWQTQTRGTNEDEYAIYVASQCRSARLGYQNL